MKKIMIWTLIVIGAVIPLTSYSVWEYCVPYNASQTIDDCVSNCLAEDDQCVADSWPGYYCQFTITPSGCNLLPHNTTVTRRVHPCVPTGGNSCWCDKGYTESSDSIVAFKDNASCTTTQ